MAKFVLTTWAACLARQKPVSTRAKPACMKITRIGAEDDPEQVELLAQRGDGVSLLGASHGGEGQQGGDRHAEADDGPSGGGCPAERPGAGTRGHAAFLSGALRWGPDAVV